MRNAQCGRGSPNIQAGSFFTLLISFQQLKQKLNKPNQEKERDKSLRIAQFHLGRVVFPEQMLMWGFQREITKTEITGWNGACIQEATTVASVILDFLSYLKSFWRSDQQSFTSHCFCVMLAARTGWRLDSWDMLTSSIYHTQACRLGREGLCNTLSGSDQAPLLQFKRRSLPWFGWRPHVFRCLQSHPPLWMQMCSSSERQCVSVHVRISFVRRKHSLWDVYHVINSK